MKNPHFDDNIVLWNDDYSGKYFPPHAGYEEQFDLQWKIALDDRGYFDDPGASTDNKYIEDRIYEWTGKRPNGNTFYDNSNGVKTLDHPIDINLIKDKNCIDIGCGMGRWTKTMLNLEAKSVLSIDVSESGLKNVIKFNSNIKSVNILEIPNNHQDLVNKFDFACFWGVVMHTHDPLKAFMSAASTVKSGGAMYLMAYAPEGMHGLPLINIQRKKFYEQTNLTDKLKYLEQVYCRKWDSDYPFKENIKNFIKNLVMWEKSGKIGLLDMLEPYYNWVISIDTIYGWMGKAGFSHVSLLNEFQSVKCANHVLGIKK